MNPGPKKSKILFVGDKWCAGKYEWGVSEWENNIYLSLKETGLAETDAFHFDEYYRINHQRGDKALLQKIAEWKPDMVFFVIYLEPGSAVNVPEWATFETIKDTLKIPMASIWGDFGIPEQVATSKKMLPFFTLCLATASDSIVKRIKSSVSSPEKYAYMWVPKNPKIFNDPGKKRDIEVSYVGTPKGHRLARVKYLIANGVPTYHSGGERQDHFTTEDYADKFQRSKITISFSRSVSAHVINARPFEAMLCGAMVLEEENFETPKMFVPYVDYVPYSSNKDLLNKAKYYLEHDDERRAIAENGRKKMLAAYSAERFWRFVIDKTVYKNDTRTPTFVLAWRDLRHMPKWRAVKLKFLEWLCSSETGFKIFLYVSRRTNKGWVDYQMNKIKRLAARIKALKK